MSALKSPKTTAEDYGPAMLALDERQQRYVRARVWDGLNATQAARKAGYAGGVQAHQMRVQGYRMEHSDKVVAAMREEGERLLGHATPLAIAGLVRALDSKSEARRAWAVENVLDRTGYGRRSQQDIRVEHVDARSTADLLGAVAEYLVGKGVAAPKLIDVTPAPVQQSVANETLCCTAPDSKE